MKILICFLSAFIASVSCTLFGGGGGGGNQGSGFSAFAGLGKNKGFVGGIGGLPSFPFPIQAFTFPLPFGPSGPLPPTQIIKVIHEHVNAPGPSKVVKVVHHHQQVAIPALHEHVKVIQDGEAPISLPVEAYGQQSLSYGSSLPAESGIQVLDGGHGGNIID